MSQNETIRPQVRVEVDEAAYSKSLDLFGKSLGYP